MQQRNAGLPEGDIEFRDAVAVGTGGARQAYARMLGEGFDSMLAHVVVYGIAEGYSRESGNPDGDANRFHDGHGPEAGAELPDGLDAETLEDRARDAMRDERLFDGMTVEQIEEVALLVGADLRRDLAPAP